MKKLFSVKRAAALLGVIAFAFLLLCWHYLPPELGRIFRHKREAELVGMHINEEAMMIRPYNDRDADLLRKVAAAADVNMPQDDIERFVGVEATINT